MAWNEPDDQDNDKPKNKKQDPWGGRGSESPPDLDEVIRDLKKKFNRYFAAKGGNGATPSSDGGGPGARTGITLVMAALLFLWVISGIFIVKPAEQAVVLRFGKYVKTVGPGPHWIPRFITSKYIIDVNKVSNFTTSASMLTEDENIVSVTVAVHYRVGDPYNYLFKVVSPRETLKQATASAVRQVIGHTTLDDILTVGRETAREQIRKQLVSVLNLYDAGIVTTDVVLQPAKPPEEVKAAFDDAIKAQEDEQRFINQAQAYQRGVIPIAEGGAKRILQEAGAYKKQVILQAQGGTASFLALLPEYLHAPAVTRERLYLDTVESVLMKTSKVLLDIKDSNNLIYLPIDRMGRQSHAKNDAAMVLAKNVASQAAARVKSQSREAQQQENYITRRRRRDEYRGRGGKF